MAKPSKNAQRSVVQRQHQAATDISVALLDWASDSRSLYRLLEPVAEWLRVLAIENHSTHTLSAYAAGLKQLALFIDAKGLTWTRCDKRQLANYISQRLERDKLALASVQQELSATRHFYGWLIERGQARINPTTGYQLKRSPRPLPAIIDVDMMTQLLDQPMPWRDHVLMVFFRREFGKAGWGGDFHVDAEAVGVKPGFADQLR